MASRFEIRSPSEASALGIEFIHQELSVLDNLDVGAHIFLHRETTKGGWLKLVDRKRIYREADAILHGSALMSPVAPAESVSLAQQQLVEIARHSAPALALSSWNDVESDAHRDAALARKSPKTQGPERQHHYISHRMHEVEEIADARGCVRDGKKPARFRAVSHARTHGAHDGWARPQRIFKVAFEKQSQNGGEGFEVRRLRTIRYPNQRISFNVAKGEVLGFAGLVGAGRSEVARAIFGVEEAIETEVVLNGEALRIKDPQDAITHGIYLIPEDRRACGLIVDFNVRENISLQTLNITRQQRSSHHAKETSAAAAAVKAINIKTPTPEMRAANLSGGNQQKVVLARWLTFSPRVLIFDEPTRGIDVGAKAEIYELIRKLAAQGVSVIVISSEMEEVLGISDRIAVMHEGRLTGILERPQFSEEAVMRLATGTEG